MSLSLRIRACHKCLHAAGRRCSGPCACPTSGEDISGHYHGGYCPRGYFAGDAILPMPATERRPCCKDKATTPATFNAE